MDLNNLDNETVFANEELLASWLNSYNGNIDTSIGTAVRELVIKPAARYYTASHEEVSTTIANLSVTEGTNEEMVEKMLSNFNVTRKTGTVASGYLAVYTNRNNNLYIPSTLAFTVGSDVVVLSNSYIGVANVEDVLDNTRYKVLRQYDDSTWYMIIPASTAEPTGNVLSAGQSASLSFSVDGVVKTEVAATFVGGTVEETLDEMKARAEEGITAKVPSGKAHIEAMLTNLTTVNVQDVSVIGMGDSEMLRGRANVYGTNPGGRVDIYSRTANYPTSLELSLTGTLINVAEQRWRVLISKADAPAFYLVSAISHSGVEGVMTYTGDIEYTFSVDISNETYIPDCSDGTQARYTKFQTAAIEFDFTGLNGTVVGETTTFNVIVLLLPAIDTVQDYLSSYDVRNQAGDYLVKAPVPMFVGVEVLIKYSEGRTAPDEEALKGAISSSVNLIPMKRGYVSSAEIANAIYDTDPNLVVVSPIVLTGMLYDPSGQQHAYRSVDTLQVEEDLSQAVSSNTVAFFCTPSMVSLSIVKTNEYLT